MVFFSTKYLISRYSSSFQYKKKHNYVNKYHTSFMYGPEIAVTNIYQNISKLIYKSYFELNY